MSSEIPQNAYETVLADLKAKRAQLDQAIAAIEGLMTGSANAAITGTAALTANATVVGAAQPPSLGPGAFLGLTIADAARKLLEYHRKAMGTKEIMEAIQAGGVHLTGTTPLNTVQTVLGRQADIIKVGRGIWALAAWYPNSGRFKKKGAVEKEDGSAKTEGAASEEDASKSPKAERPAIEQSPNLKVVH